MAQYNTKQQKAILDYLQNCQSHVTAFQIVDYLKQNGFEIGITTVYRHLEKLSSQGIVNKIIADNEKSALFCYSHNCQNDDNFHIKCEICGEISDMDCSHLSELYCHLKNEHSFTINPKKTLFYGICCNCQNKKE